ncbi:MAG TPA: class I SAM-dependent methyltransferase [Longimicrobium sp.]|jgi:2-polyprenyl-3-methyl-5-hydroxy-6-metoxy-1,4-benzoquinol methylase
MPPSSSTAGTVPARLLTRIRLASLRRNPVDVMEKVFLRTRERMFGTDLSVFDNTIAFYREERGQVLTREEAFSRALDKQAHKDRWFVEKRQTFEEIVSFYSESETYPFRQPWGTRFGGYRWYMDLVRHIPNPSVLEYGCGSAVLTEWLLARYPHARFTVADIPSLTLDFVRWKQRALKLPYRILTIGPRPEDIPVTEQYDLIICSNVLEHTPNPLQIVTAFVDHLNPGGVLVADFVNDPGGENLDAAVREREAVKAHLLRHMVPVKAIDEPAGVNGVYVKPYPA